MAVRWLPPAVASRDGREPMGIESRLCDICGRETESQLGVCTRTQECIREYHKRATTVNSSNAKEKDCERCGKVFTPRRGGRPQRFCSDVCKRKFFSAQSRHGPVSPTEFTCQHCGKVFKPESPKARPKYCSYECNREVANARRRHRGNNGTCTRCGASFTWETAIGKVPKYCSDECRKEATRQLRAASVITINAICKNCGNKFSHAINGSNSWVRQYCGACWFTAKCLECRNEFQYKRHKSGYGQHRKFCSDECRKYETIKTRCQVCRIEFSYKEHRTSGQIRPRCPEHAREYKYSPKACGRCGNFYIPASGMSRYCSDECFRDHKNAKLREQATQRPLVSSWCENCGISFQSKTGARFCTASCRSTFDRRQKGNYELGSHRRRAEYYGCEYDETVTRVAILIRDKWTCGICGDPIPQDAAYPSREYGSLDHIIPMSRQGGHTLGNTQAAHMECNMRKHASMPEEMPTAEL